jgi:hypothetical protein
MGGEHEDHSCLDECRCALSLSLFLWDAEGDSHRGPSGHSVRMRVAAHNAFLAFPRIGPAASGVGTGNSDARLNPALRKLRMQARQARQGGLLQKVKSPPSPSGSPVSPGSP